jgi:hypothetical protein
MDVDAGRFGVQDRSLVRLLRIEPENQAGGPAER